MDIGLTWSIELHEISVFFLIYYIFYLDDLDALILWVDCRDQIWDSLSTIGIRVMIMNLGLSYEMEDGMMTSQ